jgi:Bacterial protein of unknown function (DUF899)
MTGTRQRPPGMNTPPIVSQEAWEAARQQMLAKEKAYTSAGDLATESRRMPWTVENRLRNFPPGPDQAEVSASLHTAGYRASPTTVENHSRVLSRFLIAACGGVAATVAWWSYGDAARHLIASSYTQLRGLAPSRVLTAQEIPDMIVPNPNQRDAMSRQPQATRQGLDTNRTVTSVDQAPSAHADSIPVESRGDAPSLQPTVPLKMKPTEAKAIPASSQKGDQLSALNRHDASCFPSASAVHRSYPDARPSWTLRAPGHEGTRCWYPNKVN